MAKRALIVLLAVVLSTGLVPSPAMAEKPSFGERASVDRSLQLESGTYAEHEAIAYVMGSNVQGGAQNGAWARALSSEGDLLFSAEPLMAVDADAAAEAFGEEAVEGGTEASAASGAARIRSFSAAASEQEAPAGALVLVRDESMSAEELIAKLESDPRVAFAEPNYLLEESAEDDVVQTDPRGQSETSVQENALDRLEASVQEGSTDEGAPAGDDDAKGSEGSVGSKPTVFATDSDIPASDMTGFQWGMSNDGTMAGIAAEGAVDIGYGAWEQAAASGDWAQAAAQERSRMEDVVIAVIDRGVDETNPDLAGVLWNGGEDYPQLVALGGDKHGFSALPGTTSTSPISADQYHGTHVAGIIAAAWDGLGVSGAAPNAEIMSVRNDADTVSRALSSINYVIEAARAGVNVRIANCSWGMGAGASRAFDIAFTQLGHEGVMSVLAAGNAASDMDAALNTISTLRDNPYVVVVDSLDASGVLSLFSCYGQATTDITAPGSTILSTMPMSAQRYLGEIDSSSAFYESFDEKTRVDARTGVEGGSAILRFTYTTLGGEAAVADDIPRFDGSSALELAYSVDAAAAMGLGGDMVAQSTGVDLSGLAGKPRYLSIRMLSTGSDGQVCCPIVTIAVKTVDGGVSDPIAPVSSFGLGGGGWSGFYIELPEDTDFEDFRLLLFYQNLEVSILGGERSAAPTDGTVFIDSIGLGSELVPYDYEQGTSMAAPAVAGAAAVMAGLFPDDSAAQLAARVKGAAQGDAYGDVCSTGGYASADAGADPAPVPVSARASDDGLTVAVRGYFVSQDARVSIGGVPCTVLSRDDSVGGAGDEGLSELVVAAPEGFSAGEAWVEIASRSKSGRMLVDLGQVAEDGQQGEPREQLYDQANLPVPVELEDWNSWQLVGFAGDVYALPRENEFGSDADHEFMLRYDPVSREWSRIAVPSAEQRAAAGWGNVASMSGTTYRGSLLIQITSRFYNEDGGIRHAASYWRYTAEGVWEQVPVALPDGSRISLSALDSSGDDLYVFGGVGTYGLDDPDGVEGDVATIFRLDDENGALQPVGKMLRARHNAQVAYRDGTFLVGSGQNEEAQEGASMGVERIRMLDEAQSVVLPTGEQVQLPAGSLTSMPVAMSTLVTETGQLAFAPAAVADGFMIAGPRSDDGMADTYTLEDADGALPQKYGKFASGQRLLAPSALAYDGMLYVLAATESAPYRVFSATAVEARVQPGDYEPPATTPADPQPAPAPADSGEGFDAGTSDGEDGSDVVFESLASTGDGPAFPVLGAVSVAAIVTAAAARRQAGGRPFVRK